LINFSEPGVSPTGQRALLSALRRDAVDKLNARKEDQRVRALERLESYTGSTAGARGGSFKKSKFQKKKRVKANKVVCDDPATHTCLCCEDYDADREPTYPCGDFQDTEMRSDDDSEEDDDNFVQRLPCVDGLAQCVSCATPRHVPEDPSPTGPPTILTHTSTLTLLARDKTPKCRREELI
jgi:hypothetical protein